MKWDDAKLDEHRYITRHDLDAVSPDNPVLLAHISGHFGVANSAALKAVGLAKDTPDPQGGVLEHDASGELTGIVKDTALNIFATHIPVTAPGLEARAAKLATEEAAEVGLTTIHDISLTSPSIKGYQDAYDRGWLKVRVQMAPLIQSVADAETLAHQGVHTGFGNDWLKYGAAKLFADGGMGCANHRYLSAWGDWRAG